jgi:ribosomal protein S18 acetylase RimI-like enzyme
LLGRLAVDRNYANLGIGTSLVAHVLATAVELNQKAACRAVVVSALNPGARGWWERLGFHSFDPQDPQQLDMYLLTPEIGSTLGRRGKGGRGAA